MIEKEQKVLDYLNSLEKCKASGEIIKILKYEDKCTNYYRFKFNDGTRDFIMSGTEPKLELSSTGCSDKIYTFSGGEVPKVGDNIYLIGINPLSMILELGKDSYDSNVNLDYCSVYYVGSPSYDTYLWADKCKVSGKVESIARSFTDTCGLNLGIKVKNVEDTYIVGGREYFSGKGISLCLGAGEGRFPIDSTDGKITTQIKSGDDFYAVLDQKDSTILRYGQDEYNADNSTPICTGATTKQIQSFKGGITEEQLKQIMDTVEKQIVHDFPDLNNKTNNTTSSGTNTISTGITTIVKEKIHELTKPIVSTSKISYIPKQAVMTKKESINTSSINITDSGITDNSTQLSTGINEEVNTGVITQKETTNTEMTGSLHEVEKDDSSNINNFTVYGIILFAGIILYIIYRNLRIKK